jgi:hypothetical protein
MRYNNDPMNEDIKTEEATEPVVAAAENAEIRTEDAPVVEAPVEEAKPEETAAPESTEAAPEAEAPVEEKPQEVAA